MSDHPNMLIVILVANAAIAMIQFAARRVVPLGRNGEFGIYVMLLPLGFACMGVDFPVLILSGSVLLGLGVLLFAVRRLTYGARPDLAVSPSDPVKS